MTEDAVQPSLEEILSSIRRIISEDPPTAETSGASSRRPRNSRSQEIDDVLVLTRRAPMNGHAEPPAAEEPPTAAPEPAAEEEPAVLAPETQASAAAALDKLASVAREEPRAPAVLMPPPGRTIEDVIRELMRPMLKAWLDEHLPRIVEARVDEEIDRIIRHRVR